MANKTLLYKNEYKDVEEGTVPKFTPEEIGHILYTIEKGFGFHVIFESTPFEIKNFGGNFRSIINSSRLDLTFLHKTAFVEYDFDSGKKIGYKINDEVEKVDITSFFTKVKNGVSEHKIYQIGGRYSESIEEIRGFRDEIRDKSLEEKKDLLEGITNNSEFKAYHPKKKEFYLNILREIYNKLSLEKKYWKIQRRIEEAVAKQMDEKKLVKDDLNITANPFNVDLKKFEFLKKDQVQIQRTKSLVYKREYTKGTTISELTIEDIGDILVEVSMIPHYLDYEEGKHLVNFRNIRDGTRKDITFHYAHIVPIFGDAVDERGVLQPIGEDITGKVTEVDNVSFFTNEKNGISEHRIYQIGARYEAKELTIDDLFGLGELNYDIEHYDKAIEYYNKVLEIEPEDLDTINNLGLAFVSKTNYKEAISLYQKALNIDPEDSITWDNLGLAYEYNNEYDKAKDAYQKASDLDSSDEDIQQHLTEINEKINNLKR